MANIPNVESKLCFYGLPWRFLPVYNLVFFLLATNEGSLTRIATNEAIYIDNMCSRVRFHGARGE